MELLIINGHDYSSFVKRKGYGWSRNDLDSNKSTRTKDGILRRDKIATKRKLTYQLMGMTREQLAQLDDDLSEATFPATYLDLHGRMTRTFYCSVFTADMTDVRDDEWSWEAAAFSMTEI